MKTIRPVLPLIGVTKCLSGTLAERNDSALRSYGERVARLGHCGIAHTARIARGLAARARLAEHWAALARKRREEAEAAKAQAGAVACAA